MCTVTFIPGRDGVCLTSNRDENLTRQTALPPQVYSTGDDAYIYPKDPDAGGSWIVLKNKSAAAVLLNGAFVKHRRYPPYRTSRGLVLLEIIKASDPLRHFRQIDLRHIEPFTLVLYFKGILQDCRWDGTEKHVELLDASTSHIWSSATLYDKDAMTTRQRWFEDWIRSRTRITADEIIQFHRTAGSDDPRNSLLRPASDTISTVSVTSIVMSDKDSRMIYNDLRTGDSSIEKIDESFSASRATNGRQRFWWALSRSWTRLTHWEYWPAHLVYGPLYLYWLWLSLRARSFFFFSAANPRIQNAGFTHEKKSDIYLQIPGRYYPRTVLCPVGTDCSSLKRQLETWNFSYPLIAKPDIGERGSKVRLLNTFPELEDYCNTSRVDFLVQEFVSYPQEAGIFYARIPGEEKGRITGIVGKEFLAVTGDGRSTIRTLLRLDPRHHLQLRVLTARYGHLLDTILPSGINYTLVPYGNHCLGSKFVDWSNRISDQLAEVIDGVCRQIPEFYYGRLDIKFADWNDLLNGKGFSIIELNGAGSEPTHIYDPSHSIFFAWKEIIRHWRLLHRISLINAKHRKIPLMSTGEGWRMLRDHARHQRLLKDL
ncbi:MAG: NRDE family protein [Bacteroidetes bacterium]|nr:NRDE family protein [Bacteroidota bacterium]